MKNRGKRHSEGLICWIGMIALFSLSGCVPAPVPVGGVTSVPVAMHATEAKAADALATVDETATVAAGIINTALAQQPSLTAAADEEKQTQAAMHATQTAAALPPTLTPTPTPDLAAIATQLAAIEQATAVAAALTATAAEQATEQAAIAATLTALAPTITPIPTASDTPTPDLDATKTEDARQMEAAVAATLTALAELFTPTSPPTNTPVPPTDTPLPRPTNTPRPTRKTGGSFKGSVNPICTGDRNMTWFEGTIYVNNQPANGYKIVFKSYLVPGDQPATDPAISGPHKGYTDWPNGYYAHIVNDHFEKKHLEIWIINDAGQALSDRVRWNSDGADGPCNKAVINFSQ